MENQNKPDGQLWDTLHRKRFHFVVILALVTTVLAVTVGNNLFQGDLLGNQSAQNGSADARRAARLEERKRKRGITTGPTVSFLGDLLAIIGNGSTSVPVLDKTIFPVDRIPNWGAMRTSDQWDRTYAQMTDADFVSIPPYDLSQLTIPMSSLSSPLLDKNIPIITAKLFYSTRYFASYSVDADEFTGMHSGVDLKLPIGTPIGAIGNGIVRYAANDGALGLHVIIEHKLISGEKVFSIYGHFSTIAVKEGDQVDAGQTIGTVGMTGNTTAPHLHLQVDRETGTDPHVPWSPLYAPTKAQAAKWSINPITFIQDHAEQTSP